LIAPTLAAERVEAAVAVLAVAFDKLRQRRCARRLSVSKPLLPFSPLPSTSSGNGGALGG